MTPQGPEDFDYEQLARYFADECSAREVATIRTWIAANPTRSRQIELLRQSWESSGGIAPRGDLDAGWATISAKLAEDANNFVAKGAAPHRLRLQVPTRRTVVRRVVSRAAAIVVAVGLGAVAAREVGWRKPAAPTRPSAAPVMREVVTKPGQRADVYLSDGTHVILGVGSKLRFPTAFAQTRDVDLDGEAYFEVAHDTTRSFAVHMRYGTARDLGTQFAVRAYRDMAAATVTVTEGSVLVTPPARDTSRSLASNVGNIAGVDSVVVRAMDVARLSADGHLSVRRGVRTDAQLAWMSGRLVFDQMPVSEAVAQINRWYDTDVTLGDSTLAKYTLTASLTNESFPRAIKIIADALDARVERHRSTIVLFSTRGRS